MAVEGSKFIELLMQALEEGDTVRFTDCLNKLLSYKVSESLAHHRKLIAQHMFKEDLVDLVKTSNLNRDKDDDAAAEEDELLPNIDLAARASADDETRNFEEGSESERLDTFHR